jgi:hypothetical protein
MNLTFLDVRCRGWCFTVNNYLPADVAKVRALMEGPHAAQYLVFGYEVGDKEKTPHLQGYVYWANARKGRSVKKLLPRRPHIEHQKGTCKEASDYCKKEVKYGPWEEFGELPQEAGKQSCLDKMVETYEKEGLLAAAKDHKSTFVRFGAGLMRLHQLTQRITSAELPKKVVWISGPSKAGKSRLGFDLCFEFLHGDTKGLFKWDATNLRFLNGYVDERAALFDDYKFDPADSAQLLNITDCYQHNVPIKGGSALWMVEYIVFTSCLTARDALQGFTGQEFIQFERRITEMIVVRPDHSWQFTKRDGKTDAEIEAERARLNEIAMRQQMGEEEEMMDADDVTL